MEELARPKEGVIQDDGDPGKLGRHADYAPNGRYAHKEDPFGNEEHSEVKYKTMTWWQCSMVMIAETIALGILSLPSALAQLGMVPGVILIIGLGLLATYTGYVIGQFKLRYPHVHNMSDAGEVLFGRIGGELLGMAQIIFLVFLMGSHVLTFSVMMNTLSEHGTCTIVFAIVGMLVSLVCTLPRTLLKVSYLSIASFISILGAVFITMIGIGIEKPGAGQVTATVSSNLYLGFGAVTDIIFAYAGHVNFFSFMSELRDPPGYAKALYVLQAADTTIYVVAAVVIYYYGGIDVSSPALGSTSPVVRKVAYGIAIPTIVIAGVINGHVASKYIYIRLFRGTDRMSKRSLFSFGMWVLIATVLWVLAWIIAEAIPVFNNLLSLITALFASWFTYGISGYFWLYMTKGRYTSSPMKMFLTVANIFTFSVGAAVCGLGLYAAGKAIHDTPSGGSFSCADNST